MDADKLALLATLALALLALSAARTASHGIRWAGWIRPVAIPLAISPSIIGPTASQSGDAAEATSTMGRSGSASPVAGLYTVWCRKVR